MAVHHSLLDLDPTQHHHSRIDDALERRSRKRREVEPVVTSANALSQLGPDHLKHLVQIVHGPILHQTGPNANWGGRTRPEGKKLK